MSNTGSGKRKILLVEDDAVTALAEKRELESIGHGVLHVLSGEAALSLLSSDPDCADLIIMDIDLGRGMDGVEAARALLSLKELPLIFLSSHTDSSFLEKAEEVTSYGYIVKNSGTVVLDASIKMAFRLHAAFQREKAKEAELAESRESLKAVIEGSGAGTWDWNLKSGELRVNDRYISMLGYRREELEPITGATFVSLLHPDDLPASRKIDSDYESGLISSHELVERLRHKDGHWVWICDRGKIIERDRSGRPLRMSGVHFDISALKAAELELEESRNQLKLAIEGLNIGLWDLDVASGRTAFSGYWAGMLGYSPEKIEGLRPEVWKSVVHPEDYPRARRSIEDYLRGESRSLEFEVRLRHRDGHWIWALTRGRVVEGDGAGGHRRMLGMQIDISYLKRIEDEQRNLVAQKEALMKELQHRVKNNLNIISSLLGLEMMNLPGQAERRAFESAITRIRAMALIYERLCVSADPSEVELGSYLRDIVKSIFQALGMASRKIRLELELGSFRIEAGKAVILGLIVNELVINILKYAFPGDGGGLVRVELSERAGALCLLVADDGVGLPANIEEKKKDHLGLSLVAMLVGQIEGRLEIESREGTRVSICLPSSSLEPEDRE